MQLARYMEDSTAGNAKSEDLEWLHEIGNKSVECAIRAQTDTEVLTEWLLLAASVKTVGEFQEQIGSISGK